MSQPTTGFQALENQQYMNLVTFRKSGDPVRTPVWFASANGKLYVMTINDSGKVKRIRANKVVMVAPSDGRGKPLGPEVAGSVLILPAEANQQADDLLNRKYGFVKRMFDVFGMLNGSKSKRVYLEISPADA